jgi:hypothetical protein
MVVERMADGGWRMEELGGNAHDYVLAMESGWKVQSKAA